MYKQLLLNPGPEAAKLVAKLNAAMEAGGVNKAAWPEFGNIVLRCMLQPNNCPITITTLQGIFLLANVLSHLVEGVDEEVPSGIVDDLLRVYRN